MRVRPLPKTISRLDMSGLQFAVNIFVAATLLWVIIRAFEGLNPIWAISSMIAASEPKVEQALKFFRGRLINAMIGCVTGLCILVVGGMSDWKIPLALSTSVLISSYLVQVPVMWRQAPITATIVVAGGLGAQSKMHGMHEGLRRVGEVLLGCVVGLAVTFLMSQLWPSAQDEAATQPSAGSVSRG
jgi:uncharacterized membrane protein YccC